MRMLHGKCVEKSAQVFGKHVQRVSSSWRSAAAVSTGVKTKHAISRFQQLGLLIPHRLVASQRMTHDQPWALAFNGVADFNAVGLYPHRNLPLKAEAWILPGSGITGTRACLFSRNIPGSGMQAGS